MYSSPLLRCLNRSHISAIELLDHQRAVLRTEADAVAERNPDTGFTRFIGNVVEITIRVRLVEVDRRWDLVGVHRATRGAQAGRATRALRMSDLRLGGRHGNARGLAVERTL